MVDVLALIPARGGSKGIPRKNIRLLGGVPLIAYSIAAGLQSNLVSRVIVSTDDEEIAAVARKFGAETPFLRPAKFAQDDTIDLPVFQHALKWLAERESYSPDLVVQLRPTTPFRPKDCVDRALEIMFENPHATSVRGVIPSGQNPYKMWRITDSGRMNPLIDSEFQEPYNMLRQKLPQTYWQSGHIDVIRTQVILDGSMSGTVIYPLHIDPRFTVDLDTLLDWERASKRLEEGSLPIVRPLESIQSTHRPLPAQVDLVVLDFDGVMTDNRVYVNQNGIEMVAANRGDGMGIARLREAGIEVMILSTETNPVVAARARKLKLPVIHSVGDKGKVIKEVIQKRSVSSQNVIFLGNDVNDLPCFPIVGCALAVADAHPDVLSKADIVLSKRGGYGAVRELCDLLLSSR